MFSEALVGSVRLVFFSYLIRTVLSDYSACIGFATIEEPSVSERNIERYNCYQRRRLAFGANKVCVVCD